MHVAYLAIMLDFPLGMWQLLASTSMALMSCSSTCGRAVALTQVANGKTLTSRSAMDMAVPYQQSQQTSAKIRNSRIFTFME